MQFLEQKSQTIRQLIKPLLKTLFAIYKTVIDYILPPRCLSCKELAFGADGFCAPCFNKLNFITMPQCQICGYALAILIAENMICGKCSFEKPVYDKARSLLKFDQNIQKLIHNFKYYDNTSAAEIFAKLIYTKYKTELFDIDYIIPVPMHKLKRLLRMYNQAQILAKELSVISNKPLRSDILIKTKFTRSQARLSKIERQRNLTGSMKAASNINLKNKSVLIVDDVMTTGSTVSKCAKLLKTIGAKKIYVVTIAMT